MFKKILPKTLFGRSLLIIVTPVILLQLISLWVFFDRHWENVNRRLALAVASDVAYVLDQLKHVRDDQEKEIIFKQSDIFLNLRWDHVADAEAYLASGPVYLSSGVAIFDALTEKIPVPFTSAFILATKAVEITLFTEKGKFRVIVPERRLYSSTAHIYLLWLLGSTIVLFAIALIFMRNQIRPIRRLALAADRFGKGRDVPDFKPQGALEIRQAATAFQKMKERIQRQIDQRTEMLAGVSHDLRTPLTRMKLQLEIAPDVQGVEFLRQDIHDMESMINEYLAFARGEGSETPAPTDVDHLVYEAADNLQRQGGHITVSGRTRTTIPLRPIALRRCLTNLMHNAVRYASEVWVCVERYNQMISITIDDNGPGIPFEAREDVFKPFFRLDSSRNPATGGVGLGMTIARDIARGHGGDVTLQDSPHGGLRAIVTLPI